jgi:protein-tyrosine phosphatase
MKDPSAHDVNYLESRNIKTIIDFRDANEKKLVPDAAIGSVVNVCELPIDLGSIDNLLSDIDPHSPILLMEEMYRLFVRESRPQYREFFRTISNPEYAPVLFHCSGGKDRTGLAAVFILSALGVDKNTVYEDYLLTEKCLKGKYSEWIARNKELEPLVTVERSYLDAAFAVLDEQYGGIERYLVDELGADLRLLRELYTE